METPYVDRKLDVLFEHFDEWIYTGVMKGQIYSRVEDGPDTDEHTAEEYSQFVRGQEAAIDERIALIREECGSEAALADRLRRWRTRVRRTASPLMCIMRYFEKRLPNMEKYGWLCPSADDVIQDLQTVDLADADNVAAMRFVIAETDDWHWWKLDGMRRIADFLLRNGAAPNPRVGIRQESVLHRCVLSGNAQLCQLLLEYKADVNCTNQAGNTPLHLWAKRRNLTEESKAIGELLIEHRADVNSDNRAGDTPLHMCARAGDAQVCQLLLNSKAELLYPGSQSADTPLHTSTRYQNHAVTDVLLQAGACPYKPNFRNQYAIDVARLPVQRPPPESATEPTSPIVDGGSDEEEESDTDSCREPKRPDPNFAQHAALLWNRDKNVNLAAGLLPSRLGAGLSPPRLYDGTVFRMICEHIPWYIRPIVFLDPFIPAYFSRPYLAYDNDDFLAFRVLEDKSVEGKNMPQFSRVFAWVRTCL